jgi:hypothetical protein
MAMKVVVQKESFQSLGSLLMRIADITFDNSYTAGGYLLTASQVELADIFASFVVGGNALGVALGISTRTSGTNRYLQAGLQSSGIEDYSIPVAKGGEEPAVTDETIDRNALGVNPATIVTAGTFTSFGGAAGTLTVTANRPDVPRNVVIWITGNSGYNLTVGTITFVVTGTFRGAPQVDTITITNLDATKAVGSGKFRGKAGVKPFDSVTSITYTNAGDVLLSVGVGYGIRFGLPKNGLTGTAATDLQKIVVNDVDVTNSAWYNETNKTVLGHATSLADSPSIFVSYLASDEAQSGQDLSTATVRMMFIGM